MSLLFTLCAGAQVTGGAVPETNAQLFNPSIDSERTLWTDDSGTQTSGGSVRLLFHHARDPVVYADANGNVVDVLSNINQLSGLFAFNLGRLRLGLDVPIHLRAIGVNGGETGLGDIGVEGRFRLLDRTKSVLGLAVVGRLNTPTSTMDTPLGNQRLGWGARLIADVEVGPVLLAANLGTRGIRKVELENFVWDDQFDVRLGAGLALSQKAGLSLDLGGKLTYANLVPGSAPAEGIVGAYGRLGSFVLRGGVGTALNQGFGAPTLRLIGGVGYEPRKTGDRDRDGLADADDRCPDRPEDIDQWEDTDGCPEPTDVTVRVVDPSGRPLPGRWTVQSGSSRGTAGESGTTVRLDAGTTRFRASAEQHVTDEPSIRIPDGPPHTIDVPLEPMPNPSSVLVNILDESGRPIPGATWRMAEPNTQRGSNRIVTPLSPGTYEVLVEAPGHRTQRRPVTIDPGEAEEMTFQLAPSLAEIVGERIDIRDSVYFETSKAIIKSESFDLLNEVAEILDAHPELVRIRIEGHTDVRGSDSYNLSLSRRRAAAVLTYLVGAGVSRDRLESQGFGESKPIDPRNVAEAWKVNRRVDFFVVERSD